MEDVHAIVAPDCQAECVQVDMSLHLRVNASQVELKLAVDEDPHVIITFEGEHLAAAVRKRDVYLACEQVVMSSIVHFVEQLTIEREVRAALERRDESHWIVRERQVLLKAHVDTRHVGEPLREAVAVGEHELRAIAIRAAANWLLVGPERRLDEPGRRPRVVDAAQKVRVAGVKVAINNGYDHVRHDGLNARRRVGRKWRGWRRRGWRRRRRRRRRGWVGRRRRWATLDQPERRGQLEVGSIRLALRVKHVELVGLADGKSEGVQIDRPLHLRVNTTEVNGEPAVDEDPHVVVAAEAERLDARVCEIDVVLGREEEVVKPAVRVRR